MGGLDRVDGIEGLATVDGAMLGVAFGALDVADFWGEY